MVSLVWEAFHEPTQLPIDLVIDPALMTLVGVDHDVLGPVPPP